MAEKSSESGRINAAAEMAAGRTEHLSEKCDPKEQSLSDNVKINQSK